jgi:hypothetical protein
MTRTESSAAIVLLTTIVLGSVFACFVLFRKPHEQIAFDFAGWNAPFCANPRPTV